MRLFVEVNGEAIRRFGFGANSMWGFARLRYAKERRYIKCNQALAWLGQPVRLPTF